jgi:hypothetical protein
VRGAFLAALDRTICRARSQIRTRIETKFLSYLEHTKKGREKRKIKLVLIMVRSLERPRTSRGIERMRPKSEFTAKGVRPTLIMIATCRTLWPLGRFGREVPKVQCFGRRVTLATSNGGPSLGMSAKSAKVKGSNGWNGISI